MLTDIEMFGQTTRSRRCCRQLIDVDEVSGGPFEKAEVLHKSLLLYNMSIFELSSHRLYGCINKRILISAFSAKSPNCSKLAGTSSNILQNVLQTMHRGSYSSFSIRSVDMEDFTTSTAHMMTLTFRTKSVILHLFSETFSNVIEKTYRSSRS